MIDITEVATAIVRMIATGTTERELLARVAAQFPELTRTEFLAALQDATAAAERRASRSPASSTMSGAIPVSEEQLEFFGRL
jgi:hypothetical protein